MLVFGLCSTSDDQLSDTSNENHPKYEKVATKSSKNEMLIFGLLADLKNQPIVSSFVTHILPFCGYFKGQEEICFNPTSWHLVTYNFL